MAAEGLEILAGRLLATAKLEACELHVCAVAGGYGGLDCVVRRAGVVQCRRHRHGNQWCRHRLRQWFGLLLVGQQAGDGGSALQACPGAPLPKPHPNLDVIAFGRQATTEVGLRNACAVHVLHASEVLVFAGVIREHAAALEKELAEDLAGALGDRLLRAAIHLAKPLDVKVREAQPLPQIVPQSWLYLRQQRGVPSPGKGARSRHHDAQEVEGPLFVGGRRGQG
mmetsp:Transcript_25635/g.58224  ORF Transcript_25635/g.58224 Transcript_25635/m.58224 type:complete len:225 (+) Transcript_25635:517-1191(+)